MTSTSNVVSLKGLIGKGYKDIWDSKARYRVIKGSRASKKSKNIAINLIVKLMEYPEANALVVRQVYSTLKDSCFADLKWAINRIGVRHLWEWKQSPLEMTYTPTGQKILFRGMDDVYKITSISVEKGYLCFVWIEEAYQIMSEADFDTLDESIRGYIPTETGLYKQITLTFNPWSKSSWLKRRFFDCEPTEDIFATTTNYLCNEWLDEADLRKFEAMKRDNPERYKVAGLGDWGIDGLVFFPEFSASDHVIKPIDIPSHWRKYRCIDYGMDMLACYWIAMDEVGNAYVYRELYEGRDNGKGKDGHGHIISEAAARIKEMNDGDIVDITFAPPDLWNRRQETGRSVADIFEENGLILDKVSNDRIAGWSALREWFKVQKNEFGEMKPKLQIFSTCVNLVRSLQELQYDERKINDAANEPHEITHAPDALRCFAVYWTRPTDATKPKHKIKWSSDIWDDYYQADEQGKAYLIEKYGNPF